MGNNNAKKPKINLILVQILAIFLIGLGVVIFSGVVHAYSNDFFEKIEEKVESIFHVKFDDDPLSSQKNESNNTEKQDSPTVSKFSFAVMGDTQSFDKNNKNGNLQKAVAEIKKKNPDLVFSIGDLVSSCETEKECSKKLEDWKTVTEPILEKNYEVMGNHDALAGKGSVKAWQKAFDLPKNGPKGLEETVYSFDYAHFHFVVLNSDFPDEHKVSDDQISWLEEDLSKNLQKNIFVFFHEPAFPTGHKTGSSLDAKRKQRDKLWQALEKYKTRAVFSGHEHMYSERLIGEKDIPGAVGDIWQVIVGQTDAYDYDEGPERGMADYYHMGADFIVVEVDGEAVTVRLYFTSGELINTREIKS